MNGNWENECQYCGKRMRNIDEAIYHANNCDGEPMDQSRMLADVRKQADIVRSRVEYHFRSTDGGFLPCPEMPFMKEFLGEIDRLLRKIEHVG